MLTIAILRSMYYVCFSCQSCLPDDQILQLIVADANQLKKAAITYCINELCSQDIADNCSRPPHGQGISNFGIRRPGASSNNPRFFTYNALMVASFITSDLIAWDSLPTRKTTSMGSRISGSGPDVIYDASIEKIILSS